MKTLKWGLLYTAAFLAAFVGSALLKMNSDPTHGKYNMLSGDQDLSDLGDMLSSDQDGKPLEETDSIGDFARSEMNPQEEVADKIPELTEQEDIPAQAEETASNGKNKKKKIRRARIFYFRFFSSVLFFHQSFKRFRQGTDHDLRFLSD